MTRPWLIAPPAGDATRQALLACIPQLKTERLILRAPDIDDWDDLEPIWRTDRSRFIGGPFNEEDAWLDFAQTAASWLFRGIGFWTVVLKDGGKILGLTGIGQETTDPELEFGWLFLEAAEGKGYAFEATSAVRAYAFETLGLTTLVSMVASGNQRSHALAKRLGATPDDNAVPNDYRGQVVAYRHSPESAL